MSKVLTIRTALSDDGRLDVECASMAGGRLCAASLPHKSTVEDVVEALKPQLGLPKAYFDVYVAGEIILDRCQLACSHKELIISEDSLGPPRKFLAALSKKAFDPNSHHFDQKWTERTAPDVDQAEVARFLEDLGLSSHEEAVRLMRVLGCLTSIAESWNMFNLEYLQKFEPGIKTFKHALCEHWLHVARNAAKQKVSRDPGPLFLPCLDGRGCIFRVSLFGADAAFPQSVGRPLQGSLSKANVRPQHRLGELMLASASLDSDASEISSEVVREAFRSWQLDVVLEPRPSPEDVVRMAHVQLLLSCNVGPVEVEGNLPANLVQHVAAALRWHVRVLRFGIDPFADKALAQHLEQAMQVAFEGRGRFRGVSWP